MNCISIINTLKNRKNTLLKYFLRKLYGTSKLINISTSFYDIIQKIIIKLYRIYQCHRPANSMGPFASQSLATTHLSKYKTDCAVTKRGSRQTGLISVNE